jgi:hypothetical protein
VVRRTYTFVVFGAGVLLVIAAVLKVVGYGPGIALCFLGIALFGLSFIPRAEPSEESGPMTFLQKLTGIFFEPSAVFRSLRSHPSWLAPLVIIALVNFAYTTAFVQRLTPERIVSFTTDKVIERFNLPPEQAEQMKAQQLADAKSPAKVAGNAVTTFVGLFVFAAIFAGLWLLLVLLFGGRLGFWQALSVAAWAWLPPELIRNVLSLVLLYIKDPDDMHPILGQGGLVTDNLGVLMKPGEHPILFGVLSGFGVLVFYQLWLTATGLRNTGQRVSAGSAWAIVLILWGIRLLLSAASGALFGNFIS